MAQLNEKFTEIVNSIDEGLLELKKFTEAKYNTSEDLTDIDYDNFWQLYSEAWHGLGCQGFEVSKTFIKSESTEHLEYVKGLQCYELLQESDFYWQIINKPFGYAGDAKMMEIIYRNDFDGKSLFGKVINKFTTNEKACTAVRNRKEFLITEIEKIGEGKILSIAAGPAEEIIEILNKFKQDNFEFIAIDHDINTAKQVICATNDKRMTYCIGNAFELMKGNFSYAKPRKFSINTCDPKSDFLGIQKIFAPLKYSFHKLKRESFELVYSAGLFDYIKTFEENEKGTKALTKHLFSLVKPGGTLIIGNFSPELPDHIRFSMEYFQNWQLIYRNKNEMMEFINAINESEIADAQILMEPERINYFLKIVKR